jgi:hypothetical protein
MLPPSLPPSTHFGTPVLDAHLAPASPYTFGLPSPSVFAPPLPLLSALPSPVGSTLSLSRLPVGYAQSPGPSTPQSLYAEPSTSHVFQPPPSIGEAWSSDLQEIFEISIARLTAAAGLPLSWVDNPEWIDFIYKFLPWATSPSRKVLTTRLIPRVVENCRQIAKRAVKGQNVTIQAGGWTGVNFHHLLAFMITVNKKVRFILHLEGFLLITSLDLHGQRARRILRTQDS